MLGAKGAGRAVGAWCGLAVQVGLPAGQGDQAGDAWAGGCGSSQPYLGPRGVGCCPGGKMIDCCDVRSHVVSECVEGGWLMPGT
jgi:hypothetical protein